MEIAKLILEFFNALKWPILIVFVIFRFKEELRGFLSKVLHSNEIELDILGQKIKFKALEKLTEEVPNFQKVIYDDLKPDHNTLQNMRLFNIISKLSSDQVLLLRKISHEETLNGYCGCEAERLVLEEFVDKKILDRDQRGFYHPTDFGKRIFFALKSL
jgi:hypothetical protein